MWVYCHKITKLVFFNINLPLRGILGAKKKIYVAAQLETFPYAKAPHLF